MQSPKTESERNEKEMKETIAKIIKTKCWFFEKINKIDKPLTRLIKKKRQSAQINKNRTERWDVTTDTTEILRIIRLLQLYTNKMYNLEEMNKFLKKCNLPRLNQKETQNINRLITSNKIK